MKEVNFKYAILTFKNGLKRVTKVHVDSTQQSVENNYLNLEMSLKATHEKRLISTVSKVELIDYIVIERVKL